MLAAPERARSTIDDRSGRPMKVIVRPMTPGRVAAARAIAIAADFLQIVVFPAFTEGGISPLDAGLDLAVAALMTILVGWHWAFLPSFAAELVPFVDLVPTWTAAVFLATRGSRGTTAKPHPPPPPPGGEGEREARIIEERTVR
jgi:hypothetical protein